MNCGTATVKYLLFIFNFLFFISGIAILTVGAITLADNSKLAETSGKDVYRLSIFMIVIGCLVMSITFFGCCGAIRESRCMLLTFAVLLFLMFVMQLAAAIAAFIYRKDLKTVVTKELNSSLNKYDRTNSSAEANLMWDQLQHAVKCCGAYNYTDWKDILQNSSVPISCCTEIKAGCGDGQITRNTTDIYQEGCVDKFEHQTSRNFLIIAGVALGIAFIQIIGICFACCLASALKNNR